MWKQIISRKIDNQARCLSIIGKDGADTISSYLGQITDDTIDSIEAVAAKQYFSYYHEGLNRRVSNPINSRLNYGYAVVRSSISRSLVATGFHPTFGIHHNSQLNAFNLADDLIEPYRAIVDVVDYQHIGSNVLFSKAERREIASVLHNACIVNGTKVNLLSAIELMCESLKRIVLEESHESLIMPTILPIERMEGITE